MRYLALLQIHLAPLFSTKLHVSLSHTYKARQNLNLVNDLRVSGTTKSPRGSPVDPWIGDSLARVSQEA